MELSPTDQVWLLACSGLVLLMQAGFLCLEAGLTRSKNAVNVALKNVADLAITPLLFWTVGFGLMFGTTWCGLIGVPGGPERASGGLVAFFVFQMLFCATAATIVSGAVAERMRFGAYVLVCVLVSGLVYPVVGHWAWGGAVSGTPGWLESFGYIDFAGSSVVHMTGGFAALAAAIAVGPRLGRFEEGRLTSGFPKSSLPIAMLGTLLLVTGWIGFNGGSGLRMDDSV
ncbi:MAG: ammonia permease, partial [Planctomycetota bacterium]